MSSLAALFPRSALLRCGALALLVLTAVNVAAAQPRGVAEVLEWEEWKAVFRKGKPYNGTAEEATRRAAFEANLEVIAGHNAKVRPVPA